MNAIEIENLSKSFGVGLGLKKAMAVKQLTLNIFEGEVFGLIGPNGAGKTTTLKMVLGLTHPTSGSIRIFGGDAKEANHRSEIGFLPERPYFYQYLTAIEFLHFYGQLFGLPTEVREERARKLLARVGMANHADTALRKFSKGMLQRMGMAQALIGDPKLIVLDEPMSGLDPLGRMLIRDIIMDLKKEGRTILFSSHILSDVEVICDRIGILAKGELKEVGTVDTLLHSRVKATEITVMGKASDLPASVADLADSITETPDRVLITVSSDTNKNTINRALLDANVPILALTPRHDSLEDIFVARLARSEDQVAKGGAAR